MKPRVSVICLCYNHERFVEEAILSVLQQTYKNIELIVVDDASTDDSQQIIKDIVEKYPSIIYLPLDTNHGNCVAFNRGLKQATGDYIIDLAADDMLCPERVEAGVEAFLQKDNTYGVNFSNSEAVDVGGNFIKHHYSVNEQGRAKVDVPEGDVFEEVIQRYFISPPTIMFKKEVISQLGGYDESLTYEDFDFWVRSSRHFKYVYTDRVLVKKRVVKGSLGHKQFQLWSSHLLSTYKVCRKIGTMLEGESERLALKNRLKYEIGVAVRLLSFGVAFKYLKLLRSL